MGWPISTSGGHTHGAADLRPAQALGYVLRDDGTWGTADASALGDQAVGTSKIADAGVTSAKLDPRTIQFVEKSFTAAEVKALRATPLEVIPAPGEGKVIQVLEGMAFLDYGGTNGFTETADNLCLYYAGETLAASGQIETTGFLDQTADTMLPIAAATVSAQAKTAIDNKAITIKNLGDGEIAGNAANDNVLRIQVAYRVYAAGW